MGSRYCRFIRCAIIGLGVVIAACASDDFVQYPGLKAGVQEYYRLEQSSNWEAAYEYRTPNYRGTVPKERYISFMKKDNTGWTLKDYRVLSVSETNGKVVIRIEFVEAPPVAYLEQHLPKGAHLAEISMEDNTVWININGTWYCEDAGQRQHLPLNAGIAPR